MNATFMARRGRIAPQKAVWVNSSRFWYTDSAFAYYMGTLPGPPFPVKPAQRYLPEVLCCRKGIIIIKVVNDKPPSCRFLVVNSGECNL